ncbi:hypothetical protein KUCAC02_024642, partial [Chaenocephalus aceratus]
KIIKVRVIDDEEYEKNKTFYLEISGPRLVGSNDTKVNMQQKTMTIRILDREEYNKQSSFYVLLEQPEWRRSGKERTEDQLKEVEEDEEALAGRDEDDQRVADMGRPMLGDHVKLEVIIEESYEFKNTVDKLIKEDQPGSAGGNQQLERPVHRGHHCER